MFVFCLYSQQHTEICIGFEPLQSQFTWALCPFVPNNLSSAQQSPVPLPKFQMAPRFKTLMPSESKKGTQIYYPFHSKSPGKRIPSRFPNGAPMESDIGLQSIFTPLLIYFFYLSLRFPGKVKGTPSMSPNSVPMDRDTTSQELLVYLFIHSFIHVCLKESPTQQCKKNC